MTYHVMYQECPTIWRIYEYFTHEEREDRLKLNALSEGKAFDGEGGEAYIATDQWCHTCGECGHLGDVGICQCCLKSGYADTIAGLPESRLPTGG